MVKKLPLSYAVGKEGQVEGGKEVIQALNQPCSRKLEAHQSRCNWNQLLQFTALQGLIAYSIQAQNDLKIA